MQYTKTRAHDTRSCSAFAKSARTIDERQRGLQHARVDRARRGVDLDHIVEHDAVKVAGERQRGAHLVESANLELRDPER